MARRTSWSRARPEPLPAASGNTASKRRTTWCSRRCGTGNTGAHGRPRWRSWRWIHPRRTKALMARARARAVNGDGFPGASSRNSTSQIARAQAAREAIRHELRCPVVASRKPRLTRPHGAAGAPARHGRASTRTAVGTIPPPQASSRPSDVQEDEVPEQRVLERGRPVVTCEMLTGAGNTRLVRAGGRRGGAGAGRGSSACGWR